MYWRDVAYLCTPRETLDKFNRPQNNGFTKREVICDVNGVKRTEFYQAQAAGYKPEITVDVKKWEYEKERYLEYDGVMYKIIRTYPVKNECLELVCEGFTDGNG
jgi:hypothetical protein